MASGTTALSAEQNALYSAALHNPGVLAFVRGETGSLNAVQGRIVQQLMADNTVYSRLQSSSGAAVGSKDTGKKNTPRSGNTSQGRHTNSRNPQSGFGAGIPFGIRAPHRTTSATTSKIKNGGGSTPAQPAGFALPTPGTNPGKNGNPGGRGSRDARSNRTPKAGSSSRSNRPARQEDVDGDEEMSDAYMPMQLPAAGPSAEQIQFEYDRLRTVYDPLHPPADDPTTAEGVALGVIADARGRKWREQIMRLGRWVASGDVSYPSGRWGQPEPCDLEDLRPGEREALDIDFRRAAVKKRRPVKGASGRVVVDQFWAERGKTSPWEVFCRRLWDRPPKEVMVAPEGAYVAPQDRRPTPPGAGPFIPPSVLATASNLPTPPSTQQRPTTKDIPTNKQAPIRQPALAPTTTGPATGQGAKPPQQPGQAGQAAGQGGSGAATGSTGVHPQVTSQVQKPVVDNRTGGPSGSTPSAPKSTNATGTNTAVTPGPQSTFGSTSTKATRSSPRYVKQNGIMMLVEDQPATSGNAGSGNATSSFATRTDQSANSPTSREGSGPIEETQPVNPTPGFQHQPVTATTAGSQHQPLMENPRAQHQPVTTTTTAGPQQQPSTNTSTFQQQHPVNPTPGSQHQPVPTTTTGSQHQPLMENPRAQHQPVTTTTTAGPQQQPSTNTPKTQPQPQPTLYPDLSQYLKDTGNDLEPEEIKRRLQAAAERYAVVHRPDPATGLPPHLGPYTDASGRTSERPATIFYPPLNTGIATGAPGPQNTAATTDTSTGAPGPQNTTAATGGDSRWDKSRGIKFANGPPAAINLGGPMPGHDVGFVTNTPKSTSTQTTQQPQSEGTVPNPSTTGAKPTDASGSTGTGTQTTQTPQPKGRVPKDSAAGTSDPSMGVINLGGPKPMPGNGGTKLTNASGSTSTQTTQPPQVKGTVPNPSAAGVKPTNASESTSTQTTQTPQPKGNTPHPGTPRFTATANNPIMLTEEQVRAGGGGPPNGATNPQGDPEHPYKPFPDEVVDIPEGDSEAGGDDDDYGQWGAGGNQQPPPGGNQQPPPGGNQQPPPGGNQQPPPGGNQQPLPGGNQQPPPGGNQQPSPGGNQQPPPGGSTDVSGPVPFPKRGIFAPEYIQPVLRPSGRAKPDHVAENENVGLQSALAGSRTEPRKKGFLRFTESTAGGSGSSEFDAISSSSPVAQAVAARSVRVVKPAAREKRNVTWAPLPSEEEVRGVVGGGLKTRSAGTYRKSVGRRGYGTWR